MCRLVGIVTSESTEFGLVLRDAPRSLASLSREHPDGWGIAVIERDGDWSVHKGHERASEDERFHEIAARSRGHVLIAHVRQKTIGPTRIENTHPFRRDGWIFAHNGTIEDLAALRSRSSRARRNEVEGDTDSELLFAVFLTRLDEAGLLRPADEDSRDAASRIVESTARELRDANVGAFNFLLSDGRTCFAHRYGRSLFILERTPSDPVRATREVTSDAMLVTHWSTRRHAVLVASERVTDEPWEEVPSGTFLRIDRDQLADVRLHTSPERAA